MKTLLTMSLTGGLLALLVAALRAVLREKLHPRLVYALWLPVLICLLVPVRLPSAVSILNAPPVQRVQTAVQQQMEVPLPIQGEWQTAAPVQEEPALSAPETPVYEPAAPAKEERKLDVWAVAGWIWAAGALAVAAYTLAVNLRFALRVCRSRQPVALSGAMARSLRGMRVYCSRAVPSPCLMGVLRPCIVVTPLALESEQRLRHVLMHERSHKRQGDHWFALLRSAALVVHWFNPLVWWAAALSREDGENACDALALRALGEEERIDYGKTLLAFLRKKPSASALVNTSTAMAQSRGQIRRRIALISKKRKYTVLLAMLAIALVLAGCAATMTDAQPTATANATPETTPEATAPATPTAAPETPQPDNRPDWVRDKMEELESNIADLAPAFSSLTAEETGALLPELSTDFVLYGRRNEQDETYAIAVGKPGLSITSDDASEVLWDVGTVVPGENDEEYQQMRQYAANQDGETRVYRSYEVRGVSSVQWLGENSFLIVIQDEQGLLRLASNPTELGIYRYAQAHGLQTQPSEESPFAQIYLMNDETQQATGIYEPIGYVFPLTQEQWQKLEPRLQNVTPLAKDEDMVAFWENMITTNDAVVNGSMRYQPARGCVLVYGEYGIEGTIEDEALATELAALFAEKRGTDVLDFDPEQWLEPGLTAATLQVLAYDEQGKMQKMEQTLTEGEELEDLRALLSDGQELTGGAGCPFTGRLQLTRSDGQQLVLFIATDSCGVYTLEGARYLDYGKQEDLLALFPDCTWY